MQMIERQPVSACLLVSEMFESVHLCLVWVYLYGSPFFYLLETLNLYSITHFSGVEKNSLILCNYFKLLPYIGST